MSLGRKIKQLREREGIQQKDFASKIGVSNVVLSRYESDERKPDYDTLLKIADYFEVSIDFLLDRADRQKTTENINIENLSAYQQEVLDFFMSREDLFFKDKPENILDALEQFEIYYELYKKQQEKKK